jgi:DNA-binding response OmpR family regulator
MDRPLENSRRILVVEDEPLIAMYIEEALVQSGLSIVGPFDTVATAADAARRFEGAGALLDLVLDGEDASGIAHILASRQIPFIVMTGKDDGFGLPGEQARPILRKPFQSGDLIKQIRSAFGVADNHAG